MERSNPDACLNDVVLCRRAAMSAVFGIAALSWAGWAAGVDRLTRIHPNWPQMMPWTGVWLVALGAAIWAQSGDPSRGRVFAGRALALVVGVLALITLVEYGTRGLGGLDEVWFGDAVRASGWAWPGRPSPQTAASSLPLATAIGLMRVDGRASVVWPAFIAAGGVIPFVTVGAYLFDALALVGTSSSTGQALMTALALLLLDAAIVLARPDRFPVAWLLARPDKTSLLRLAAILAGFPVVVAVARPIFLSLGLGEQTVWTFSILLGTAIVGAITFFFTQREQKLLIEKELASKKRAEAEMRYRILADNAVDIVVHLRGSELAWVSPSVEAALGVPPQAWMGPQDLDRYVHPEDVEAVSTALSRVTAGESVLHRFRVHSTDGVYHWVEGHGKPYVDAEGNTDGLIAAMRIIDEQVEAEQRLERLARFDPLTGLANRAEAIGRLATALEQSQPEGISVGVLYCDVDHFKDINDTWGHGIGDIVLATLATRIQKSVRRGDTVGRTGGDEILVLLPGVRSIDELTRIAEKIRCRASEPIHASGKTFSATLSIGATLALPGESVDTVTSRADAAMYQAKLGARNTVQRI
ncbi:sensor domain-containing diguanylate cyclase [Mycobacterium sp. 050128]|uniref:sensor domain-containing diguanylate cyclase n=1 Tax=Mycobacterium sp. 050128 TaxID=3096112 RepID=UPI002ED890DA